MKLKAIILILFSASVGLFSIREIHAQSFSTGINPSIIKIQATSPSVINAPINLENSSDQNITYSIFLRPFKANSGLNGEPDFDPELTEEYKDFFENVAVSDQGTTLNEITLSPKQRKNLSLVIQVIDQIEPRDYYFTAIFLAQPASVSGNRNEVKNRGGIGTNILLTVGPRNNPIGRISNFTAPKFITNGPVGFDLELANLNDYFVTPKGSIIIKNMFGQPVGNIPIEPTNILANSNRSISGSGNKLIWNEKFLLGIYKADLSVALTEDGPLLTQSKTFFALPVMPLLIILAMLLFFFWLYRTAKKRNQLS